jgi:hypothetical protein
MSRHSGRDIAVDHFLKSVASVIDFVKNNAANDCEKNYEYQRSLMDKSLDFIESCDRNYTKENCCDDE